MKCPIDGTDLVMSERSGIEIDYCPQCRGVWLDRGELDKIIERVAAYEAPPSPSIQDVRKRKNDDPEFYDDDYYEDRQRRSAPGHTRRKSFLDDVFDIFD